MHIKPLALLALLPAVVTTVVAAETNASTASTANTNVQRMPTVTSLDTSILKDEQPVGPTGRPEWTSARRFATTRVYIQRDPWEFGIEQWWRLRHNRDGTFQSRLTSELEIGLPYRMQADIYEEIYVTGDRRAYQEAVAFELRWALADWNKIPMNPTLYAEYKITDNAPDVFEAKLLLGGNIVPGWHYGINAVWERELGGSLTNEFQVVGGISRTIIDEVFSLGAEAKYVAENTVGNRNDAEHKFLIGPSMQLRFLKNFHFDVTALFGVTDESQLQEFWFILGYDFGRGSKEQPRVTTSGVRN